MFSTVGKVIFYPYIYVPNKKHWPNNTTLKCRFSTGLELQNPVDSWANSIARDTFLLLSGVYLEQRAKSRSIFLCTQGCISACGVARADCTLFCLMAGGDSRAICLRRNPGTPADEIGSLWMVQWSRLFAGLSLCGGIENEPAFLPQPKSWFHLVLLGKREQFWLWILFAPGGVLNGGNASYGSFLQVFCKVGWCCRPLFLLASTQCCSREQLFVLPSELGSSSFGFQFCCFAMSVPMPCFCFRNVSGFPESY